MQLWGSWTFFGIAFLWDWNENWPFQSCGYCWVFQIFWHIECRTFTASYFRIWNSSTGLPSPPRALFIVMLPKAHLTSHSRMSGSRWVFTPLWLSGSWRSFCRWGQILLQKGKKKREKGEGVNEPWWHNFLLMWPYSQVIDSDNIFQSEMSLENSRKKCPRVTYV